MEGEILGYVAGLITATASPILKDLLVHAMTRPKLKVAILGAENHPNSPSAGWTIRLAIENSGSKFDTLVASYLWPDSQSKKNDPSFFSMGEQAGHFDPWSFKEPVRIEASNVERVTLRFWYTQNNPPEILSLKFQSGNEFEIAVQNYPIVSALFQKKASMKAQYFTKALSNGHLIEPVWFFPQMRCLHCFALFRWSRRKN